MIFVQLHFVSSVPTRVTVRHEKETIAGNVDGERSFLVHVGGPWVTIEQDDHDPVKVEVPEYLNIHDVVLSDTLRCSIELADFDPCGHVELDHFVRSPQGEGSGTVFPSI